MKKTYAQKNSKNTSLNGQSQAPSVFFTSSVSSPNKLEISPTEFVLTTFFDLVREIQLPLSELCQICEVTKAKMDDFLTLEAQDISFEEIFLAYIKLFSYHWKVINTATMNKE